MSEQELVLSVQHVTSGYRGRRRVSEGALSGGPPRRDL